MKKFIFILGLFLAPLAFAQHEGNGGDVQCDAVIRKIVGNIEYWVENNGAEIGPLNLSSTHYPTNGVEKARPYSFKEYKESMLEVIKKPLYSSCVSPGDKNYPVAVGDASKICKSSIESDGFHLTCDSIKFLQLNKDLEIQQIHHEFATNVEGLEPDSGPISTYKLSSQLGKYTVSVIERQLGLVSSSSEESSAEIVVPDSPRPFLLKIKGGKGSVAEEVYMNLKSGIVNNLTVATKAEVVNTFFGDSEVFIASSYDKNNEKVNVQAVSNSDQSLFEADIDIRSGYVPDMEAAVQKGMIEFYNPSLFAVLHGKTDDAKTKKPARLSKHIRCTENSCKVYLKQLAKSEQVLAKSCEFHIDKVGKFDRSQNQNLLIVAKVSPDLKDKVESVAFISDNTDFSDSYFAFSFQLVSDGYFYTTLSTLLGPGEGGYRDISNKGYFLLSLKDGRALTLRPKENESFVIDPNFARNLSVKLSQETEDKSALKKIIQSMPSTAAILQRDGSARYINPYSCQ
jgi:hypothetical protein